MYWVLLFSCIFCTEVEETASFWTCSYRGERSYDDYSITVRMLEYGVNRMACLEVSGKGIMAFTNQPWKEVREVLISRVKIVDYVVNGETRQSEIESIQAYAFSNLPDLGVVNLAKSKNLRFIDRNAFANCVGLAEVVLPATVIGMGPMAFYNCRDLKRFLWEGQRDPGSVLYLGSQCFAQCSNFSAALFNDVQDIGVGMECFANCTALSNFVWNKTNEGTNEKMAIWISNISATLDRLGNVGVELNAMIEENILSQNLSELSFYRHELNGYFDYYRKDIKSTGSMINQLLENVMDMLHVSGVIGERAFMGCTRLSTVEISDVKYIKENAFLDCISLTEIVIRETLLMHESAFIGCDKIESFHYCGNSLQSYNGGVITLPASLWVSCIMQLPAFPKKKCNNSICKIPNYSEGKCTIPPTIAFTDDTRYSKNSRHWFVMRIAFFADCYM